MTETSTFVVPAEPARRSILDLLREQPAVGELVERLGFSQPGTSKHLRVLRPSATHPAGSERALRRRVVAWHGRPDALASSLR